MAQPHPAVDASNPRVHLLDVGPQQYGDAVLCEFNGRTVLIDGAHPGNDREQEGHAAIQDQIGELLRSRPPYHLDMLMVSHAHDDHVGCLPALVEAGTLTFDWALVADPDLGWGRARGEDRDAEVGDDRLRQVIAALRDECGPPPRELDDAALARILQDARTLEDRYRSMLGTLARRGTRVVRLGQDRVDDLEAALADVGLKVVGPSQEQIFECADFVNRSARDAAIRLRDLFQRDARLTAADVYRQLAQGALDALDVPRLGAAVNCQSVVAAFQVQGRKFLFGGDMQFQDPGFRSDVVARTMAALRRAIQQGAPYDLVKLSHHGSDNAFSEDILRELGQTVLFGICAGEHSERHPNPSTLSVLNRHKATIRWARTDRNGRVTMTFGAGTPRVSLTTGRINDPRPNAVDVPGEPAEGGEISPEPIVRRDPDLGTVEIYARIPHASTRVSITVEVAPGENPKVKVSESPLRLGDERRLSSLLFVTNAAMLADHIGRDESAQVLETLRARGLALLSDVPLAEAPGPAIDAVRRALRAAGGIRGVVLIGGHDLIPHQKLDCLPPDLRARLRDADDPDRFIVWSDDVYGDVDGDGLPEIPVSRIPDGRAATLVRAALEAPASTQGQRAGIRNVARPFADGVFAAIPGAAPLLISEPTVFDQRPSLALNADQLYFMLHGDHVDGTRFWGEDTPGNREALNIGNLPATLRGVVFTGCCWGALTTDTPAGFTQPGRPFGQRTPESSIALSALARGATAFVGCTGAHYSPMDAPYAYYGAPMHTAFWRHSSSGNPPAQALFNAKRDYFAGMPHGRTGAVQRAIEFKIWRQYTCLGLGW